MSVLLAIALREFRAMFRLPVGWISIALFLFLTGVVFATRVLVPGEAASLRAFFGLAGFLLLPVVPAISMRLLSEELRTGTIEPLMTAPVTDTAIVLGKFAGAGLFLGTLLAPTLVYPVVLHAVSDPAPDWGPIATGYAALLLLGLFYLGVGTLASALTSNQTLAFLATLLALTALLLFTSDVATGLPAWLSRLLPALSITRRLDDFAKGVLDTAHIVFFLSVTAWFVVLAVVAVQVRRWR